MTVSLLSGPASSLEEVYNDTSQLRAETELFCAKRRDELAQIKHDYRKKKESTLRTAFLYTFICIIRDLSHYEKVN